MIVSFKSKALAEIAEGKRPKRFPNELLDRTTQMLDVLDNASRVEDMASPPGNHLERLKGDRAGQYSVRINRQWRLCFEWTDAGPAHVEFVDYH